MDLELRGNNLYRNGEIIEFNDTEQLLLRDKLIWEGSEEDDYYTLKDWDRLDILAYNKYADYVEDASKYWWVIADANNIENPLDLRSWIGKELLIPNIINVLMVI